MSAAKPSAPAPLAGLVLCGGRSRRMGSEKALLELEGKRLLDVVIERLSEAADPVLLATGSPGRLGPLGLREVPDELPHAGPLAGIVAGLAASPHPMLAVVAVDMPFVSPEVLTLLGRLWDGQDAVVPVTDDGVQPLHAVYATSALPILRSGLAGGVRSVREALRELRVREVRKSEWDAADPSGRFAANVNTLGDLASLR